jgi:hypothetical protein
VTLVRYDPHAKDAQLAATTAPVTKKISALMGGTIQNGPYLLVIPPAALSRDTNISLAAVAGQDLECQLEPTGLTFQLPVTLTFNYTGTSADPNSATYTPSQNGLAAVWLNTSTSQWTNIGGVDVPLFKQFTATLSHFSYYALSK